MPRAGALAPDGPLELRRGDHDQSQLLSGLSVRGRRRMRRFIPHTLTTVQRCWVQDRLMLHGSSFTRSWLVRLDSERPAIASMRQPCSKHPLSKQSNKFVSTSHVCINELVGICSSAGPIPAWRLAPQTRKWINPQVAELFLCTTTNIKTTARTAANSSLHSTRRCPPSWAGCQQHSSRGWGSQ